MKRTIPIILLISALILGICGYIRHQDTAKSVTPTAVPAATAEPSAEPTPDPLLPADLNSIVHNINNVPIDTLPDSYTVLVTRDYLLPADYVPKDLTEPNVRFSHGEHDDKRKIRKTAATALEKMFHAAEKERIILYGVSGYRSYERQESIYNRNVSLHGKKTTDALSAKPGSSEHQCGLTIDISTSTINCVLSERFADTREGKWVAKNAHKYGYIIRYPKGKTKITGYSFEPWHIRYVGVAVATYLYKNKLTLEEFYGVSNKSETKTGVDVEDTTNYETTAPTAAPSSIE